MKKNSTHKKRSDYQSSNTITGNKKHSFKLRDTASFLLIYCVKYNLNNF